MILSSFLVLTQEASGPPLHNNVTRDRLTSWFLSDSIRRWRLQSELLSGSKSNSSWWQYHLHEYEMIFRLVFEVCFWSSCFLSLHQYFWLKISRTLVIFLIVTSWWRRCTLSLSSWHSLILVRCWRSWFYDVQWNWEMQMIVHCLFWFYKFNDELFSFRTAGPSHDLFFFFFPGQLLFISYGTSSTRKTRSLRHFVSRRSRRKKYGKNWKWTTVERFRAHYS